MLYQCTYHMNARLSLHWTLEPQKTHVRMAVIGSNSATGEYLAIGFSREGTMSGSDAVIGWPGAGGMPEWYELEAKAIRSPSKSMMDQTGRSVANEDGATVMRFRRKMSGGRVGLTRGANTMLWAIGPVRDGAAQQHSGRGAFVVSLSGGDVGPLAAPTVVKLKVLHGVLMGCGWGVLLPTGAILARWYKHLGPLWFRLHRAIQLSGLLLVLAGWVLGTHCTQTFVISRGATDRLVRFRVLGSPGRVWPTIWPHEPSACSLGAR